MKDSIFFAKSGEKGLNETSAAHLCALASQIELNNETSLKEISFVNTSVALIGSAQSLPTQEGVSEEEFNRIELRLQQISNMHRFIAWFAEARKVLEDEKSAFKSLTLEKWCQLQGIEYPEYPEKASDVPSSSFEDALKTLSLKEQEEYLSLQAITAVYGKFLHPDRPMDVARKELHYTVSHPYKTHGEGRDTSVYHSTPSIDPSKVEAKFALLQKLYRELEQRLNHLKSDIRKKQTALNIEEKNHNHELSVQYMQKLEEYRKKIEDLNQQFKAWCFTENEILSKVKFAIPNALEETVHYLNNLAENK